MALRKLAEEFTKLHVKGDPLVIFNVWDAGTARAAEEAGAKAVATGSWAVAAANGFEDGETVPPDFVTENLKRIATAVSVPVSLDFEGGYAVEPAGLKANTLRIIEAGAIGINFEDRRVPGTDLYSVGEQAARIRAIREAADEVDVPLFINARTDVVLPLDISTHTEAHLEEIIERARAYADAGASGLFAPGLANAGFIEKLCAESPIPVNILVRPGVPPSSELARLGVARISYGGGSYRIALEAFKKAAAEAIAATKLSAPATAQP